MKTHELKIKSNYLDDIESGKKTFEIRKNDRNYQVGDEIIFIIGFDYSHAMYEITYIHSELGLQEGYVVLGIKEVTAVVDKYQTQASAQDSVEVEPTGGNRKEGGY